MNSLGILEVQGLVASIEGLDAMLKAAQVRLVHTEKRLGGRLVTIGVRLRGHCAAACRITQIF